MARFEIFCATFGFLFNPARENEADDVCSAYVQYIYDQDEPMAWAADFLSAVSDKFPHLRGKLTASWRAYAAWKRLEPPQRARPAARACVRIWMYVLICCLSATSSNYRSILPVLCHIVLVFNLMRPAEVRGRHWSDVSFDISTAIPPVEFATISIDHSKTSTRKLATETTTITDPFAVFILKLGFEFSDHEKVFPFASSFFNDIFKELQRVTGTVGHTPYSLKRGGATARFFTFRSLDKLVHDGRWLSLQAARISVDDVAASLTRQRVPAEVRNPRYARFLRSFCMMLRGGGSYSYILEV
jgi:hypothetical protein